MNHDELVEKMMTAHGYGGYTSTDAMSAALRVAVEEVLKDVGNFDWEYHRSCSQCGPAATNNLLESRRSRYLKPKSAEERVVVVKRSGGEYFDVQVDGEQHFSFDGTEKGHAEIYRLGLIQQLKNDSAK